MERGVGDKNGNQPLQIGFKLTTALLDGCDLDELDDELRGAEDCEVMAESPLLPELVEICWGGGLLEPGSLLEYRRWERDDGLGNDCMYRFQDRGKDSSEKEKKRAKRRINKYTADKAQSQVE